MTNHITCPKCSTQIDVEKVLAERIGKDMNKQFVEHKSKLEADLREKENLLKTQQDALKASMLNQEQQFATELKKREQVLSLKLKADLEAEIGQEVTHYKKAYEEQRAKNQELQTKELELQKMKDTLDEQKEGIELTIKKRLAEERIQVVAKAKQEQLEEIQFTVKEKDLLIDTMKKQMEEMKRKIDQGSMQVQGEVMELAIEVNLKNRFPYDIIEEVAKGANGADILHTVMNELQQTCGRIVYESKRTKAFSQQWIDKLKSDMMIHKADIAILVTEVMPKGMSHFGLVDGVWVCRNNEVESLSFVLRESLMKMRQLMVAQENKGDKMVLLYEYLTGNEFTMQIRALVDTFTTMKDSLEKEKRAISRTWKEREKQLEIVIQNTVDIHGSIRTIGGNSVKEIESLSVEQLSIEA